MAQALTTYLDYCATTPVAPEVLSAMTPYFSANFGNASSSAHQWGWSAQNAVSKAREHVASLLQVKTNEIIFTSGATESNNWCILSLAQESLFVQKKPIHFISTNIEHPSVTEALLTVEKWGAEVSWVTADPTTGLVSVDLIEKAIRPHTQLISVIWLQNEIGTIQPIAEINALAKKYKILFHSDATQIVGKWPLALNEVTVDLVSFSAHKFHGPKGIGGLFIRSQSPKVQLPALLVGGGQERGLRSGTLNVPGIVGLGEASRIAQSRMSKTTQHVTELSTYFRSALQYEFPELQWNGSPAHCSPYVFNFYIPNLDPLLLTPLMTKVALSQGSACHSSGPQTISPILQALQRTGDQAARSLRLSISRETNLVDLQTAIDLLKKALK